MRKWRNCTSLHSTVLSQEQADYISVKVEGPFQRWAPPLFRFKIHSMVLSRSVFDSAQRWRKIAEVVGLGELFADQARVRDDPGRELDREELFEIELDREELFAIELDID